MPMITIIQGEVVRKEPSDVVKLIFRSCDLFRTILSCFIPIFAVVAGGKRFVITVGGSDIIPCKTFVPDEVHNIRDDQIKKNEH